MASVPLHPARTPVTGRALPLRRRSGDELTERLLRPRLEADGRLVIDELPLTLDVLLNPREGDQVTQSNEHERHLGTLIDRLRRFLERQRGWGVFSDVMIKWGQGIRKTSPDVAVVEGIKNPEGARRSLDLGREGGRVRAVFEVVSTSTRDQRRKDEKHVPKFYARREVEDLVLFYPPGGRAPGDPAVRVYALVGGAYRERRADAEGRYRLPTLGLWLRVGKRGELILEVVATGERLLTSAEEAAARALGRTLVRLLEKRLPLSAEARQRILDCRDARQLELWSEHVLSVTRVDELWNLS